MLKLSTYWKCQLIGWIVYSTMLFVFGLILGGIFYITLLKAIIQFTFIGIIATHLMRTILLKIRIQQKNLKIQVIYLLSITLFFSILCTSLFSFIELIVGFYKVDMDIYNILYVRTSIAFISLLIWNLIYFIYHYVERVRREEQDKAKRESQLLELEAKALRSQMNPDFVFNILNTIESYALENNKEAVSVMVQKFSRLTRLVLENSMNQLLPFENDWKSLQLYIELEQMRYADKFFVVYDIQEQILGENYLIPPMIIQPFVENAIIHGLRNKSDHSGILNLSASIQNGYIIVQVDDNGIGREKAAALKANNPIQKNSLGIKVTQDRISIFNNLSQDKKAKAEIQDMSEGTRVMIWLPAQHFNE